MRLIIRGILTALIMICLITGALANGYTLPEKMERQLLIGSGLKGTFVIHGTAGEEELPWLCELQNAEYDLRGIQSGENLHYYFYQPGDGQAMNAMTEYARIDGIEFLRSDLLDERVYQIASLDEILRFLLHADGENPSILANLLKSMLDGTDGQTKERSAVAEKLEKQIEMWISGFSADTSFLTRDDAAPRLTLEFRIPMKALYQQIANMATALSTDEEIMAVLKDRMTEEEIAIYTNAGLEAFYLESLQGLEAEGEILFRKTVSSMGEPINALLQLPMDESKTGFRILEVQNDEKKQSFTLSGKNGIYSLEMPLNFDAGAMEYDAEFRFFRGNAVNHKGDAMKDLAVRFSVQKTHTEPEDPEGIRTHETDRYIIHAEKDVTGLPEGMQAESIPEMQQYDAEIELHYSSKTELSSPTTLEFSLSVTRDSIAFFDITGNLKTASPWEFIPFATEGAAKILDFTEEEKEAVAEMWRKNAGEKIERIPKAIQ
ncbi:MAG: hypothetical protein IKQ45_02365 [Clostridia bacterium]|nr:hypothetical protein [Clostridia bacterium]